MAEPLTAELLLSAYAHGYFPMAESRHAPELLWFHPERRGIIPLNAFHVPRRLERWLRRHPFTITTNRAFRNVITACAKREDTWINDTIIALYCELHAIGYAHSIEYWQDEKLMGGMYGVALGGAFFGESMFSRAPNASKAALVHALRMLRDAGYALFDTQYVNEHLKQFGGMEISREDYLERLAAALAMEPEKCW